MENAVSPRRENVASWIQQSWEGLSFQRIATNTWRRVGLPQTAIVVGVAANPTEANNIEIEIEQDNVPVNAVLDDDDEQQIEDLYDDRDNILGDIE